MGHEDASCSVHFRAATSPVCLDVVIAVHNYSAAETTCISFQKNDIVYVLNMDTSGWWDGICNGARGWFPSNFVKSMKRPNGTYPPEIEASIPDVIINAESEDRGPSYSNSVHSDDCADDEDTVQEDLSIQSISALLHDQPTEQSEPVDNQVVEAQVGVLPANWRSKITNDGQTYYYNVTTNATAWQIDDAEEDNGANGRDDDHLTTTTQLNSSDINSNVNDNRTGVQEEPQFHTSSSLHKLSSEQLTSTNTWESLINNILRVISDLNNSAKENDKLVFVPETENVVKAVRTMLISSGTVSKNSAFLKNNVTLRSHHHQLLSALAKLVLASKVASGIWPPPDAANKMRFQAGQVLLSIRHFVSVAQDLQIVLRQVPDSRPDDVDFDLKGAQLNDVEVVLRLDQQAHSIVTAIGVVVDQASHGLESRSALIHQTREAVNQVGQLLSLIEDIRISQSSEMGIASLIAEFQTKKEALYANVNDLVTAGRTVMDQFAPPNALQVLTMSAAMVLKSVEDLLMSTKLLVEQKEHLEQVRLQVEVAELDGLKRDSDLSVLQRRAMSLNFLPNGPAAPPSPAISTGLSGSEESVNGDTFDSLPARRGHNMIGVELPYMPEIVGQNQFLTPPHSTPLPILVSTPTSTISDGHNGMHNGKILAPSPSTIRKRNSNDDSRTIHPPIRQLPPRSTSDIAKSTKRMSVASNAHDPSGQRSGKTTLMTLHDNSSSSSIESAKLTKFFGEDAATLSKKKTGKQPIKHWYLGYDYGSSDLTFNMVGRVNGGTIEALVERLTLHDVAPDSAYTNAFLLTFHLFTKPSIFLDQLIRRFCLLPPAELTPDSESYQLWYDKKLLPIRLRVYNVFKSWLETYYVEEKDDAVLDAIQHFSESTLQEIMPQAAARLEELVLRRANQVGPNHFGGHWQVKSGEKPSDMPPPILPRMSLKKASLQDIDPQEMARQLTILESRHFLQINADELLDQEWAKKERSNAPNVRALVALSTQISGWVIETILFEKDAKKRSNWLKYWIRVGDKALALNNFNLLKAILSALDSSTIERLKKTWDNLSTKYKTMFQTMRQATDHSRNFANYRAQLKTTVPPCIPFLGLYLTDLTFMDEGNPSHRGTNNSLINFAKYEKTAQIILDLLRFKEAYVLVEVADLQALIADQLQKCKVKGDGEEFYRLSLQAEPREPSLSSNPSSDVKSFISAPDTSAPGFPLNTYSATPSSVSSGATVITTVNPNHPTAI